MPWTIRAVAGGWLIAGLFSGVEVAAQAPATAPAEQQAAPAEKSEAELLREIDEAMADPAFVRQQAEQERRRAEAEQRRAEAERRQLSNPRERGGPRVRPVTPPPLAPAVTPVTASHPAGMSPSTQPSVQGSPRPRPEPGDSTPRPMESPHDEAPVPDGMRLDARQLPTVDQSELDALENEIKANPPAVPAQAQPGMPSADGSVRPGVPGRRMIQPGTQPAQPGVEPGAPAASPAAGVQPGTPGVVTRGPMSQPAGVPVAPGVHPPVGGVPGSQPANAIVGTPGPTSNAPKDATIPRHPQTGAPNLAAELKKQSGWWTLPPKERPYFFSWKNASFEDMCRDLQAMTGMSMIGLGSLEVKAPKPITFESIKIMKYDEALLQFNQIIFDLDAWVIQRDSYLEIRRLTEWYRHIPPTRIYRAEKDYDAAKLPDWDMASVSYEPKQQPAQMLAERAVDLVPVNAARATTVPNSNTIELKGFVYFLNQQLEYLHLIDVDTGGDGRELRVYPLKYASSQDAAQDLRQILPPTEGGVSITNAPAVPGGGRRAGTPPGAPPGAPAPAPAASVAISSADMVDINDDSRLNRLLIRATPSKHKMVAEYLEKFIDLPLEKIGQLEVIKVEHTSPTKLAEMIRPMLGEQKIVEVPQPVPQPGHPAPPPQPPRIINVGTTAVLTPLEQSRSLLVKAKSDEMARVKEFIKLLDVPADEGAYKYIVLKYGSASNIAGVLSTAFSSRGSSGGRSYGGVPGGSQDADFRAIPDVANDRALILMGNKKDIDDATKLIADLDVDPEAGAVEHLVHLKYATPTDVAMTLMTRFGEKGGGGGYSGYGGGYGRGYRGGGMGSSDGGLPKFIADDSSRTLIVVSTPEMWMDIERVMKELDKNADVDKITRLYKLKHAGAGNVSQILTESFGGGGGRSRWGMGYGGSDSSGAKFRFDPQTNVVIVAASDEIHEKVAALIQQLDQPSAADQAELRVIQLKTAEAQYVIDKLEELFPESGGRRGRRGGFGEYGMYGMGLMGDSAPKVPISLVAEPVSNRILITSSEEDFKKAEKYAKEIDDLYAAQEFVRKTFILQNAEADEVRNAVETMFTSGGGSGGRRRWWEPSSSSTPGSIKMTEVGNGLVVSAPKDQMAEIEKFIALLDTSPSGKNEIRSYKVQNADYQGTSEIARNLEQLYSVGRGGWDRRGSRETVRFIGSYGSDILMVSAPPEKMAEIDPIVQQMIKQSGPDTSMVIRHYELKDARPDDVADMLEPILQARFQELKEKGGGRRGGGWYGGFGGMADGPRVTAHKTGRRIMVSAPESLLPLVDELLKEFDRPAEPSTMRMIALKTAKAEEIAEIVEEQVNSSSSSSPWGGRRGRGGFRGEWSPWGGGMMSRSSGSSDAERLSATPVESSNTIILRGPNEKVAEGERLVLSLDAQAKPEGPVLRVFALQYADLYDVVSALEDIAGASEAGSGGGYSSDYDYSYSGYGSSGGRRRSRGSAPVVIQAEYSGKRIIVSAPQDKFPLIEEIIKMKEELAKPTEDTQTSSRGTVVNSRRGNITKVYDVQGSAETIAKYLDRILIDLIGYSDSPYVKSFPIANQVIVEGKPEHFTLVEEWLVRLEKQRIRAPVTMSVKQVPKGTNVARVVEMMQQAAPAEMQNRFKVSAIPKAAGRKNPLGMLNEIRYDDPIVEPEFRTATQPAVPVSSSGVRSTSLSNSPIVVSTSPFRELTDSIARLGWAAGVKITVAEPATQPATAAASQPAAAPATRPAAVEAPTTQPAAAPGPAPEPAAGAPPAPIAQPAATAPAPEATTPVAAGPAPQPAAPTPQPVSAPPPPPPTPVAPPPAAPTGEQPDRRRGVPDVELPHPSPRSDLAARAPLEPEMSAEELAKIEIGRAAAEAYQTGNVQIKYDEESGLVYFLGDPSEVKELQDTLDKIIENFEALQETPSDVRVFRLKYLDVSIAATILEQMFNDKQAAQPKKGAQPEAKKPQPNSAKDKKEEGDEDGQGGKRRRDEEQARKEAEQAQAAPGGQRIRVFPNPRDQTLIVRAAKEDFLPVAELLLKIDRPSDKPPVDIKIFQLKKLNAYEVEQAIKAILKIEDRTRTLRARPSMMRPGMPGMMANADALIEQLEQEMLEMQASGVLGGDASAPGAEGDAKGKLKLNPAKEITITSDATTNSIIVSAPQDGMKLVEKLIDNLEAQDIPSQIKTFPLKYGDAEKVSTELQKIFRAGGEGGGGGGGRMGGGEGIRPSRMGAVTVAADSRTNTIVVRALQPDMEKVEPIITKLDVAPDKGQAQVYNIENADATSLAETLRAAFVDDPKATGSLATRITPNSETNTIVVWAPDAQQKLIAEKIQELDGQAGDSAKPRQIQLKVANASTVADKLKEIFLGSRAGAGGARGRGKQRVTIVGEDSSKMLFVTAPNAIFEEVKALAETMDKTTTSDIQVFKLKHATAQEVLSRFKEMMVQVTRSGGGAIASDVYAVTADERTNSLIVAGTPATFLAVTKVLADLDAPPPDVTTVTTQMFTLVRGQAPSVAATINALHSGKQFVHGMLPPKAAAEASANVVYVTGTRAQIDEIKSKIIDPLEGAIPQPPAAVTVNDYQIPLKYANAEDVAETLDKMFQKRFAALTKSGTSTPPAEMTVSITPEPSTKRLLVTCSANNKKAIDDLLTTLDVEGATPRGQQTRVIPVKFADLGYTVQALTQVFAKVGTRVPANEQVTIAAEYGTQAIVVKAPAEEMEQILKLLEQIDNPDANKITAPETVRLVNAKASDLARTLTEMVSRTMRRDRVTGTYPVSVTPDDQSNTLLLTANTAKDMEEIKAMVKTLDSQPAAETDRVVKSYPLRYADLQSVNTAITTRFQDNAKRPIQDQVSLTPDYANMALLVTASQKNHEKVSAIIKDLDVSNFDHVAAPKIVRLQFAKASEVAATMNAMVQRSKKRDQKTGMYPITVQADDSSNTLIVTANETDMKEAESLIAQLDIEPPTETARVVKSYPLRYADLQSTTTAITARYQDNAKRPIHDQVSLTPDYANMALLVTASPKNHEKVSAIIKELDVSNFDRVVAPKTIRLANAKASEVAATMNTMIQRSKRRDQKTGLYPITASGDDSSNTILITANETDMKEAELLIKELDTQPATDTERMVKSYPLRYADLQSTTTAITARFQDNAKRPIQDQVSLTPDYTNMALMVTASPKNHEKVSAIIKELDISNLDRVVVPKTVILKHARASDVATTMNAMIQRSKKRDQKTGLYPITAAANDLSNTLVITANETDMKEAEALIAQLDIEPPTDKDRTVKPYPLQYAELQSVITAITARFSNNANRPIQDQVTFTADATNNALLVTASEENHEKVAKIVSELDTAEIKGSRLTAPETVIIRNVLPSELVKTLDRMIKASMKIDKRTGTYPVTVSSNDASGVLLVTASNDESMKEIKALIAQLDIPQLGQTERTIKTYPIEYADLTAMQKVIDARFEANKTLSQRDQVVTSIEPATGTLVITASAENHEKIAALIKEMDVSGTGVPHQEIIRLKNARAVDLYPVLQATYRTKGRAGQQPPAFGADTNSNAIVVSANKQDMAAIKELVAELDKPVDEANVEELRVITLEFIDAVETQKIMAEYLRKPGTTAGRGVEDLVGGVRIQASPLMNALVVSGASSSIDRVQKVVQGMDKEMPGAGTAPKIIPIQHASAAQLATTLTRMFTEPAEKNRTRTTGTDTVPLIMADDSTNALVVRARTVDYKMIEEMAGKLDTKTEMSGMEVVQLPRGINARQLASEIEKTVNVGEQAKQRQQPGYKPGQIAIGVDERVPALMVAGSPSLFPTVKQLVEKLQEMKPTSGMSARVVRPANIAPQDMKKVLDQLIEQQRSGGQKTSYGR